MKNRLLAGIVLLVATAEVLAGMPTNSAVLATSSIPAVGQAGLIALAFAIGLMGAYLIRKNKAR